MAEPLIEVEGVPGDAAWSHDRGLQFGDGLFETMTVRGGRIRFQSLHLARLAEGCRRLGFNVAPHELWSRVELRAARSADALLKLLVTRGDARQRGYAPSGDEVPRQVLYHHAAAPVPAGPLIAVRLAARLGENPLLAGLKHCNRLEQVLAARELRRHDAAEGLLASSSGLLISGTMSNVFVYRRGVWMTPRVDRCGIAGVMRAVVLREAAAAGESVVEAELPYSVLDDCEALCVSNVRLGLRRVASLDGRALASTEWARKLEARIGTLDE